MTKLAGVDMLGRIYDVLGKYADRAYTSKVVIGGIQEATETATFHYDDLEEAAYDYPTTCEVLDSSPEGTSFQSECSSYPKFSRDTESKMGVEGDYGAFAGSIDASFAASVRASSSYYYSSIFDTASGYILRIKDENVALLGDVQEMLDDPTVDPAEVFAEYGTHVVTGLVVGGQCRYWAYGSQSSFASLEEFTDNVEGAYGGASGSSRYRSSTAEKTGEVSTLTGVEVLGGTTSGRNAIAADGDWPAWASTIPSAPAVIAFAPDGLVPIWDFCDDATRRAAVKERFEELYVPLRGTAKRVVVQGSGDGKLVKTDDLEELAVGFGGNVNSNDNLNRIALQVENVRTGTRRWIQNEAGDLERSGSVPEGCALTGIALHAQDGHLDHVKLYYQRVNRGHSTNNGSALDREVYVMYLGGSHDGWDLDSATTTGNSKALAGVEVELENGKGKLLAHYTSDFEIAGDQG